jgi:hypothetical protein
VGQTTATQNGLYVVEASGNWMYLGQPPVVTVTDGILFQKTTWVLNGTNNYALTKDVITVKATTGTGGPASLTNLTLSGSQTIDNVVCGVGDLVGVLKQTTPIVDGVYQNGVYLITAGTDGSAGPWVKVASPAQVVVSAGVAHEGYIFTFSVEYQTYGTDKVEAVALVIATTNTTLSGEQTVDGLSLYYGDRVLIAGQDDEENNGLYVVQSGDWTLLGQPYTVTIEKGAVYGQTLWTQNFADVYAPVAGNLFLAISAVHNNYLVCTTIGSDTVNVALPALVRRDTPEGTSGRDGDTITYTGTQTRTVTLTDASWSPELQTIGPTNYAAGDSIVAAPCKISVAPDSGETPVVCQYVAMDGRAWGPVPST